MHVRERNVLGMLKAKSSNLHTVSGGWRKIWCKYVIPKNVSLHAWDSSGYWQFIDLFAVRAIKMLDKFLRHLKSGAEKEKEKAFSKDANVVFGLTDFKWLSHVSTAWPNYAAENFKHFSSTHGIRWKCCRNWHLRGSEVTKCLRVYLNMERNFHFIESTFQV